MATIDFNHKVLERSHEVPVVVDFWAAWCGPCRVLGPVITELSKEAEGRWELVKVDTEANQEIARQYNIYSIPNVKMFFKGEAVAEFTGALPKHQIVTWLEEHLPNPQREGFESLLGQIKAKPGLESLQSLETYLKDNPGFFEAELYLNWFKAISHVDAVKSWLQIHHRNTKYTTELQNIKTLVELAETEPQGSESFVKVYLAARIALQNINIEESIKQMIQAVMLNKGFQNDLPRRATIALFHLMGEDHPLTKKYRPHFSMALY